MHMNFSLPKHLGLIVLGTLIITTGCVPTVSMHSFRDVAVTISEVDSGKPVAALPFRVHYEYYPFDSPVVFHIELRTPKDVQAETDETGRVVVKLADYKWTTLLEVDDRERGYVADFILTRESIRKGGIVKQHYPVDKYPRLRLALQPIKRPDSPATSGP